MSDTAASEHNEQEHNTMISDWTVDLIAGWTSGAAAVVACQPVDTILTRWQAATTTASYPVVATATSTSTSTAVGSVGIPMGHGNGSVPGWRSLTVNLYRTAGWTALWRGASPMITAVPLQNALLMSGYGMGQRFYAGSDGVDASTAQQPLSRSKQLGAIFVGGCTGGILQSFLMSPVELIKVARQCGGKAHAKRVMQSMVHPNSTTTTTVPAVTGNPIQTSMMTTTATRGLNATLLRDGIPHGIWFLAYDICKTSLLQYALFNNNNNNGSSDLEYNDESIRNNNSSNVPVSVSLLSGAVAATVAWAVGYPADLIKTRIQASTLLTHNNNNNTNAAASTTGILETARQIVRESDGRVVAALYRGFAMKLLRSIPASMIGFTVYEGVKRRIEQTF